MLVRQYGSGDVRSRWRWRRRATRTEVRSSSASGIAHPFVVKATEKFKETVEKRSNGQLKSRSTRAASWRGAGDAGDVALGTLEMSVSGITVIYEPLYALLEAPSCTGPRPHQEGHASPSWRNSERVS